MTAKSLKWRLRELPTGDEIAQLVEQGVITKEEARDLLFSDGNDTQEENKALKEQIKFQQETIDKLIDKLNSSNAYWTIHHTYTPRYPTTYWINAVGSSSSGSLMGTASRMLNVSNNEVSFTANSEIN